MATLDSRRHALKAPHALVYQSLHERLVWDSAIFGYLLRAAKELVGNAERYLRGRLIQGLKDLSLERLVAQIVKRV